jgi:hypothetical protein
MNSKGISTRYANKKINGSFYGTINVSADTSLNLITMEEFREGKPGYVWAPYTIITPYAEYTDENGKTVRTRQVSRWMICKLWWGSMKYKLKNIFNKKHKSNLYSRYES